MRKKHWEEREGGEQQKEAELWWCRKWAEEGCKERDMDAVEGELEEYRADWEAA